MDCEFPPSPWLIDTDPPSSMLVMSYVESGMVPLPSITLLAWSHILAAEQVAPGRNLAGWRMSSLLSVPAGMLEMELVRDSLFWYNLSSAFLSLSSF